ncbi:aminotransferase class III-fold pyridoxal phosphate-dependent enzyme [Peribacillus frigoritolerans]
MHSTTFGDNPIGCSAALATLEVIKEENILDNAKKIDGFA